MLVLRYKESKNRGNHKSKANTSTKIENLKLHRQLYDDIQNLHLESVVVKKVVFHNKFLEDESSSNFNNVKLINGSKFNSIKMSNPFQQLMGFNPNSADKYQRYSSVKEKEKTKLSSNKRVFNLEFGGDPAKQNRDRDGSLQSGEYREKDTKENRDREYQADTVITEPSNYSIERVKENNFLPIIVEKTNTRGGKRTVNTQDHQRSAYDFQQNRNYNNSNTLLNSMNAAVKPKKKLITIMKETDTSKSFEKQGFEKSNSKNILVEENNRCELKKEDFPVPKRDKFISDKSIQEVVGLGNKYKVDIKLVEEEKRKKKFVMSPGARRTIFNKSPPQKLASDKQIYKDRIGEEAVQSRIKEHIKLKELIKTNKTFQYVVKPGNNPDLIRLCFSHRSNWRELGTHYSTNYNYKWKQSKKDIEYCLLTKNAPVKRVVNHFEFEFEISNKGLMFMNLLEFCDRNKLNAFNYIPFTIVMKYNQNSFKDNFKNFTDVFKRIKCYVDNSKTPVYTRYSDYFTDENVSYKCLNTLVQINNSFYDDKNFWLLKPTDLNGGKCINISNNPDEIEKLLKKYYEGVEMAEVIENDEDSGNEDDMGGIYGNSMGSPERKALEKDKEEQKKLKKYRSNFILLQKYIEKPFLYYGRKFDIRMWVLITHNMEVYYFKEGHLKTASVEYNVNTNDRFVHITNYSLQKKNTNFQKFEEGNEVSFPEFQDYLDKEFPGKDVKRDLYPQMIEIIKVSTMSVAEKINKKDRQFCYVVLGYDFIIDANFKVWLLEINKNTGLVYSSPIIRMLLPRMIDDSLRMTTDVIFGVSPDKDLNSPFSVDGYTNSENMWEYIHCLYD